MSLSISSIAVELSGAVETANQDLNSVFQFAGHLMQAAESFGSAVSGAAKKSAVLAQVKQFAESLGHMWSAIKHSVSTFVDSVKSAWNTVTGALNPTPAA